MFPGFLVAAETDREARYLVIERAEAGIGRALQRVGIDGQCGFEFCPRLFGQAECAQPAFHAGRGTQHDAFPDQRLGALRVLAAEGGGTHDQLVEGSRALRFGRGVVGGRPVGLYGQQFGIESRGGRVCAQG
jgi:hypothetical protein